jgi:hypothetical protein
MLSCPVGARIVAAINVCLEIAISDKTKDKGCFGWFFVPEGHQNSAQGLTLEHLKINGCAEAEGARDALPDESHTDCRAKVSNGDALPLEHWAIGSTFAWLGRSIWRPFSFRARRFGGWFPELKPWAEC